MGQTWILIIISILFVIGVTIMYSTLRCMKLLLWICKKSFLSTIFLVINVHPWYETNLDTPNNLHSICYGHYNHIPLIGIHDIDVLDLQEKLSFPSFSLQLIFIRDIRQTWILLIISILFVTGITIIFPLLGYTILMFWICKKSFPFHYCPFN